MEQYDTKKKFNESAPEYDDYIVNKIPKYLEMHQIIVDFARFNPEAEIKVLDIGIGTGNLAYKILSHFKNASLVGLDFSDNMVAEAKKKLKGFRDVKFEKLNIKKDIIKGKYDLAVSALTIHHVEGEKKKYFFENICRILNEKGEFIFCDIIKSPDDGMEKIYSNKWKSFMEKQKVSEKDIIELFDNYRPEDFPSTLEEQINWLKEAKFRTADCVFKYQHFAVFYAEK